MDVVLRQSTSSQNDTSISLSAGNKSTDESYSSSNDESNML